MSEDRIETVLRVFRAFRERDDAAVFACYAEDVEWDLSGYTAWADKQLFRGHEGIREFFRVWLEDFDRYESEALDPVAVGNQVAVTVVDRAYGRRSGVPIERVHGQVWTFRGDQVARIQVLDTPAAALEALDAAAGGSA